MQGTTCWGTRVRGVASAGVLAIAGVLVGCTPPPSDPGSPPTTIEPLPGPPGELSVLSYNIAGLPQGISSGDPAVNIAKISPLLDAYDVVLTQEDFDWWQPILGLLDFANYHTRLRAEAVHPYRSDRHPGPEAVGINPQARPLLVGDGIGIIAKYPLTNERHWAWSSCFGGMFPPGAGDCLAMKGFRVMTMTLGDGRLVDVYTHHAEAGGTARDQQLQEENYDELAAFMERHSAGRAIVLGGDTNLHIGSHPDGMDGADGVIWAQFLGRTGMVDVCMELDCDEPYIIDKFAYRSGGGVDLEATSIEFPRERFSNSTGGPLSDHTPVVATFSWDDTT